MENKTPKYPVHGPRAKGYTQYLNELASKEKTTPEELTREFWITKKKVGHIRNPKSVHLKF